MKSRPLHLREIGSFLSLLLGPLILAGCATGSKDGAYVDVNQLISERTSQNPGWTGREEADERIAGTIRELLSAELTAETAARIALLNNRSMRATLQEMGISHADLVQARLLTNPTLDIRPRFPLNVSGTANLEIDLMKDFMDVLTFSLRKRMSEAELERTKSRVADAALDLVAQVQTAFYTLQARLQALDMLRQGTLALEASADLARGQRQVGNISDINFSTQLAAYHQTLLEVARAETQIQSDREQMNRLLGLWGDQTNWTIANQLPDPPEADLPLEHLESLAVSRRLDLVAAQREVESLSGNLALVRRKRWTSIFNLGVDYESDIDSSKRLGPHAIFELPIFDWGKAKIARAEAQLRQSEERLSALAIDIRSQVRESRARLIAAQDTVRFYQKALLPERQQILMLAQTHYNGMQLGVYELLLAKQNESLTHRDYIETVRDYWIARSQLERAVGGTLVPPATEAKTPVVKPVSPTPQEPPPMEPMDHSKHKKDGE